MLTSRVEHDSGPAVWAAASEDGTRSGTRSGTDELDSDRAARSQADALEHFNRAASLRRVSGPTAQHSNGRSSASPRSPAESAARRVCTSGLRSQELKFCAVAREFQSCSNALTFMRTFMRTRATPSPICRNE